LKLYDSAIEDTLTDMVLELKEFNFGI